MSYQPVTMSTGDVTSRTEPLCDCWLQYSSVGRSWETQSRYQEIGWPLAAASPRPSGSTSSALVSFGSGSTISSTGAPRVIRSIIRDQPSALSSVYAPWSQVVVPKSAVVIDKMQPSGASSGSVRWRLPATAHWV